MSRRYKERPSVLLAIDCEYTSYCLDEAIDYIITKLENDEKPIFKSENKFKKNYKSFTELYKDAKISIEEES